MINTVDAGNLEENEENEEEYSRGKYIYPAGLNSRAARRQFRNMIRTGAIKTVYGVNVVAGAEVVYKTKQNSKRTNTEASMLRQLRING